MNKARLEAFSDGVFAIIITIMVLEIKVPHGSEWKDLFELWSVLISYTLSFVYIGIYWVNHHHLMHTSRKISSALLWSNINLLFWLSLTPFATAWMGENHFQTNTVVVYASLMLLDGISFSILRTTIGKSQDKSSMVFRALEGLKLKEYISTAAYSSAIPLAFINTYISFGLFVFVAIIWIIPDQGIEKALGEGK